MIKRDNNISVKQQPLNYKEYCLKVEKVDWSNKEEYELIINKFKSKSLKKWEFKEVLDIYLKLLKGVKYIPKKEKQRKIELYLKLMNNFYGILERGENQEKLKLYLQIPSNVKLRKEMFSTCIILNKKYKRLFNRSLPLLNECCNYQKMSYEEVRSMNKAVDFFHAQEILENYIGLNTQLRTYKNETHGNQKDKKLTGDIEVEVQEVVEMCTEEREEVMLKRIHELEEFLKTSSANYEKTLQKIENERDRINADRAILQNKYKALEEEQEQLREVCSANKDVIAQFEQAIKQVQEKAEILKEQNRELKEEIKNEIVSNELLEHKEEESLLGIQEQEKINEVAQEDQVLPLSAEEREKIMMERIHELEEFLKTNSANYEKALRKIEDERDRISRDKTVLQNRYKALEKEKEELQGICSANEDLIAQLEQSTRQVQEEAEALKERNRVLEEQRDKLDEVNLTMSTMMEKGDQFQKEAYKKKLAGKLGTPYSEYKDIQEIMDAGYDEDMIADIIEMLLKNLGDVWTTIKASEIQL